MATYLDLTILRASSLTSSEEIASWDARAVENRYAIEQILYHPVWGIGFVKSYRPQIYGPRDTMEWYLHNGYLWIFLKMGILGFLPFLWFSYVFVMRAIWNWSKIEDNFLKSIVLGSACSYLGIAVANLAAAHFMANWGTAVLGLSFGINEVIYRIERIDFKDDFTNCIKSSSAI